MKTRFARNIFLKKNSWGSFFHAGSTWLNAFLLLKVDYEKNPGWFFYYVNPYILCLCLELFIKSLAAHEDPSFKAREYGHDIMGILERYRKIPLFKKILDDINLIELIKEYKKTIDTRFGETTAQIDGGEATSILATVIALRQEMCVRTGLR